MTFLSELRRRRKKNKQGDVCDGLSISAFLVNHAENIEELVMAAENVERYLDANQRRMPALSEALAKLEKT
jgi:hypothetical protein